MIIDVNNATTFLTGNVGGGLKYHINDRWGVRADYRFIAVRSKDDAPAPDVVAPDLSAVADKMIAIETGA